LGQAVFAMDMDPAIRQVLKAYEARWQPVRLEPVRAAGSFSGARLWRLETLGAPLCLRRWPAEFPTQERLEFIQAVLWHVNQEGFSLVPVPLETRQRVGHVFHGGHFWELAPWLPGKADYRQAPSPVKLTAALKALAAFHRAAQTFPLAESPMMRSPAIAERSRRLQALQSGGLASLAAAIQPRDWPALAERARLLVDLFPSAAQRVAKLLSDGADLLVPIQPVIRDVWHEHVLFSGDTVSGLVDFGGLKAESVAADVARLTGSMVADDPAGWQTALNGYESVRMLSPCERRLVTVFDRSSVLLSGFQWLEWIYAEGRVFEDRAAVEGRLDEILARLKAFSLSA
jgi:Ser/Thr protein kinase RdoA (MazF antagonist)